MRVIISDYLKALLQYILPKQHLTLFAGFMANNQTPATKNKLIRYFINKYKVDMNEALEENIDAYPTFNAFFIRHLKPQCRPIANADVISPVDGYISEIGDIKKGMLLQAKGRDYSVEKLLACDPILSQQFNGGLFATLYLSPQDYHRVHMPIEGILKEMTYVPGKLFSVQPATARVIPKLFACNERLVVFFETSVGLMAMVLVGATIVGAIGTTWAGDIARGRKNRHTTYPQPLLLKKGEEMGYFKLGSTVILLFAEKHRLQWEKGLNAGDKIRFGQAFGTVHINGIE